MTRKNDKQDRWQGTAATQHADGESMLPVEKALANVSVLPSHTSVSWFSELHLWTGWDEAEKASGHT